MMGFCGFGMGVSWWEDLMNGFRMDERGCDILAGRGRKDGGGSFALLVCWCSILCVCVGGQSIYFTLLYITNPPMSENPPSSSSSSSPLCTSTATHSTDLFLPFHKKSSLRLNLSRVTHSLIHYRKLRRVAYHSGEDGDRGLERPRLDPLGAWRARLKQGYFKLRWRHEYC